MGSYALAIISDWTPLAVSDLIKLHVYDSIRLKVFDWIQLSFFPISHTFNKTIFNSSPIIRVTFQSSFRESHIVKGVFKIPQHWNIGIFHDSENINWFWLEHSKRVEKSESMNKDKDWSSSPIQCKVSEGKKKRKRKKGKSWLSDWNYQIILSAQGAKGA